jgi:hypothetical protein
MQSVAKGGQTSVNMILKKTDYGSWFWLLFIVGIFSIFWYFMARAADAADIKKNWANYRCSPSVMPFASFYGHNTAENFTYCMTNIFQSQVGGVTGPFITMLMSMASIMTTFLQNLNSLRVMLGTMVGGISKVIQEFFDRMKYLLFNIRQTGLHMKMLMGRVFAVFYSVIFMGLSAVTAGQNFGDTVIFKFLDTFCFPPETHIEIDGVGKIRIDAVRVGDRISGGGVVLSTYKFYANGQPMVRLGKIEVSTNHFVEYEGSWIPAKDHPSAEPITDWYGGAQRPLICLDVSDHRIPLGEYIFSDWDETSESDRATMILVEKGLNGSVDMNLDRSWLYQPAVHGDMKVLMADGSTKCVKDIKLCDTLAGGGLVTGLGHRVVNEFCVLPSGEKVSPSQLIWSHDKNLWIRAGHLFTVEKGSEFLHTLVVLKTANYMTVSGYTLRDMCEIHSPDMESPTAFALQRGAKPDQ